MGYRSNVKLVTTKEGWDRIVEAAQEADAESWESWLNEKYTRSLVHGKYVLLELDDVKWYDQDFPTPRAVMRMLDQFEHDGTPYRYARVGEGCDDTEFRDGVLWSEADDMPYLNIVREIVVEC